jgi:hypothetical protein
MAPLVTASVREPEPTEQARAYLRHIRGFVRELSEGVAAGWHRMGARRAARGDAAELRSTDRREGCHQRRPGRVSTRVFAGGGGCRRVRLRPGVQPSRDVDLDCRPPHRPSSCSPAMRRMESRIIRAEPPASSEDRWAGRWRASGTASTSRCTPIRCWSWARNTLGRSPTADGRRMISSGISTRPCGDPTARSCPTRTMANARTCASAKASRGGRR